MKRPILLTFVLAIALMLCGCCMKHEYTPATCTTAATCVKCGNVEGTALGHTWQEATCKAPRTCTVCGATEGEKAEHQWKAATCDEPQTCSVCGETKGKPLAHKWAEATCASPKKCELCGKTEGEALEHEWVDATCSEAKHCAVCGKKEGKPLEHTVYSWSTDSEATCKSTVVKSGTCSVCKEKVTEVIPLTAHKTDNVWTITSMPSGSKAGVRVKKCIVCGSAVEKESFTLTMEEQNAIKTAQNYLSVMGFSYKGLVEQLEYEGYSSEASRLAADCCGADWMEQAVRVAENYLSVMAFSKSGLIDQLEYEGFTYEQAVYGAEQNGY